MIGADVLPADQKLVSRDPTSHEMEVWKGYRRLFENDVAPKVKALVLLAKVGNAAQNEFETLTGKRIEVVDAETAANVAQLGQYAQIMENQITGVLLKKYGVKIEGNDLSIVGGPNVPESDIMPTFSGFGMWPIIVITGIVATTLLGGAYIVCDLLKEKTKTEALKITYNLNKLNAAMAKESPEIQKTFGKWKEETAEQVKAAAKSIPGAQGLLSKFLGEKGTAIAIAGLVAIAAIYFLIPTLRRN